MHPESHAAEADAAHFTHVVPDVQNPAFKHSALHAAEADAAQAVHTLVELK